MDFSGCNLSDVDLTEMHCDRVNFTGACLANASITFDSNFLDKEVFASSGGFRGLDYHINHLNNNGFGLLTSVNCIDSEYDELKISLMKSVIERLDRLDDHRLAGSWPSLANILLKEPAYALDAVIAGFIHKRLLPQWLESKNRGILLPEEVNVSLVLNLLNAQALTADWPSAQYQGGVNQLLFAVSQGAHQVELRQAAEQLHDRYLSQSTLHKAALALDGMEDSLSRDTYLFASQDGQRVLAVDPRLFESLISPELPKSAPWNSIYLLSVKDPEIGFEVAVPGNLKRVYATHPLLQARYAAIMDVDIGKGLVEGILGQSVHSSRFLEALYSYSYSGRLVRGSELDQLYDVFSRHWRITEGDVNDRKNSSRCLLPEHQEQLWRAVADLELEDTAHNRAVVMLCLSSMFTRFSSSHGLGVETQSPFAVRLYASALLNEACALDPELVDEGTVNDWQARLLGIGEAFTCTAVLAGMMARYMTERAVPGSSMEAVCLELYPAAWR